MRKRESFGIVEMYDKLSSTYAELYGEEQARKIQRTLGLLGDQRLDLGVDVACGTGILLEKLSGRCKYVIGVDLSRKMLQAAKALGIENGDLVRADCSNLPMKERVADYSFAISLIEACSEGESQVSELARITKANGSLVMTIFHPEGGTVELEKLGLQSVRYCAEMSARESLLLV